jgi:predicted TIM-barrel fold metal-dependent hydrolase
MISGGHSQVSHPRQIQFIAEKFSPLTIIATSGGQINICGGLLYDAGEMLKCCPNVYLETSGIYRRDFIEQMTRELGAKRIIFGSGAPYYQQNFEIERINTAEVERSNKDLILGNNVNDLIQKI